MRAYLAFLRAEAPWLGAGFALAALSTFGQTAFVAVFAGDLMARAGLSAGGWGAVYAAATSLSAVAMVWAGALADRVALPRLAAWSLAGLAATCAAMAALGPAGAVPAWALVPPVLGLRLFGQGMLGHLALVAMARWFAASRGRAVAFAALGFAAGQATLPLAFTALLPRVGAAALWLACAGVCLGAIPVVARLMRRPRLPRGRARAGDGTPGLGGRHWTRARMLRGGLFWALVPALLASPSFGTAFFFFQVHLPEAKGWSQLGFVALFPLFMAASTAATLASGALVDRLGAARAYAPALLPMAAGFALLGWAPGLGWAVPAVILLALTQGAMATVSVTLWAELYGTRHIGAVKAVAAAAMVAGTALGPGLVGAGIDAGRDFPAQMPWIAAYILAAAALAHLALRRAGPRAVAA
jgi:MFS family permease